MQFLDIRSYDYLERVKAFWNGEHVQMEDEFVDSFLTVNGCDVVIKLIASTVIVYSPPASELDDLFK